MKDKRIFVSGGAGVIGRELIEKLHLAGSKILVGDLKPRPESWSGKIKYRQGDLNFITKEELEQFKPEVFIHLAATFERSTETYEFWEENFWHNVRLSNYLMSLLKDSKSLKRVVFPSSYLIYSPELYSFEQPQQKAVRLKETDTISPRNLTGCAKLMHEVELNFLKTFQGDNFTTVSLRIFRGYGRGSRCVISRWVRALLNGESIKVYKKEGLFDYIFSGDVANGIMQVIDKPDVTGIINLGNDNARKVEEVVSILRQHFPNMNVEEGNLDIPYEASQANMDSFKQKTGWIPQMQLEETIPLIIEYEKKKLNKEVLQCNNILITSVSGKIPLIESVKKGARKLASDIKVFGGDIDENCLGALFVDEFWKMPRIDTLSADLLIKYCKENRIRHIFPTRDGELAFFAKHKEKLDSENISVMVSDILTIETCNDKLKFYREFTSAENCVIPTFSEPDQLRTVEYVVKERFGAGSSSIGIKLNKQKAIAHAKHLTHPIYQPYIAGREVSVDIYITKNGQPKGIVMRYRDEIINGESKVTTTFYDTKLEELCLSFIKSTSFYGHIILQLIIDEDNNYHIIECNPRFGGASTLSIAAGLDSFYWFLLESQEVDISDYQFFNNTEQRIRQVRYPKDEIFML